MRTVGILFLIGASAATGCTAIVGESPLRPGSRNDPDAPAASSEPLACTTEIGPRMVRRLTARQFRASIEDLFGDPNVPAGDVLSDPVVMGFTVDARQAVVRDLGAQQIMRYAEEVAAWAVATRLSQLTRCTAQEPVCQRMFIEGFGRRVYREPLPRESVDAYLAMFAAEPSFAAGAEAVIAAMLQSPFFLYRREIGVERDGVAALSGYERASALAYLATDTTPDDALLDAVASGRFESEADVDRELARLLATSRSRDALLHFVHEWLEIDDLPARVKDPVVTDFTADVRAGMMAETEALFLDVFARGGAVGDLFTADYSFLSEPLARFYGIGGVTGSTPQRVARPLGREGGVLGHGSLLARHALADSSSPVQRGIVVRERLLCQDLPSPPANVDTALSVPPGTLTTRERYAAHTQNAGCRSCHMLMDPIGLALEHYDAFGRRREQELGRPIDATGAVHRGPSGDVTLDGAASLATYLATEPAVEQCFARYLSYFVYGVDGCSREAIADGIARSDGSMRAVLASIVHAPHFARRSVD